MFKGRRKAAIVWWLEDVLWTILNQSSAGRNARADSFMDSAHENFFQKNILTRNIKTCGNIGILALLKVPKMSIMSTYVIKMVL